MKGEETALVFFSKILYYFLNISYSSKGNATTPFHISQWQQIILPNNSILFSNKLLEG